MIAERAQTLAELMLDKLETPAQYDLALVSVQRELGDEVLFRGMVIVRDFKPETDIAEDELYERLKEAGVIEGDRTDMKSVVIVHLLSTGYRTNQEAWDDRIARHNIVRGIE